MTRARPSPGEPIDWDDVHRRLSDLRKRANGEEISHDRAQAIMDERARLLSRKASEPQGERERLEVLTFVLGAERYAIETKYVREVVRMVDFTRVPGAPAFVVGVTNYRGDVLCVVDLRPFLQAASKGLTDLARIIVLGTSAAEFGILADQADTVQHLSANDILSIAQMRIQTGREYLRGMTRSGLSLLDGALLLSDSRLIVDQHQGSM